MSHPKKLRLFRLWARAMEEGASVEQPDYGKRSKAVKAGKPKRRSRKRFTRRKRKNRRRKEN